MPADLQGGRTRPAAVAGLFYPADPVRLQTEVLELLGGATPPSKVTPKRADCTARRLRLFRPRGWCSICEASGTRADHDAGRVDWASALRSRWWDCSVQRRCLRNSSWSRPCGHRNVQPNRPFRICHPNRRSARARARSGSGTAVPADRPVILPAGAARCGLRGSAGDRASAAPTVGWTGDADRREFGFVALLQLRDRTASRFIYRRSHRTRGMGKFGLEPSLWLGSRGWFADRNPAPGTSRRTPKFGSAKLPTYPATPAAVGLSSSPLLLKSCFNRAKARAALPCRQIDLVHERGSPIGATSCASRLANRAKIPNKSMR